MGDPVLFPLGNLELQGGGVLAEYGTASARGVPQEYSGAGAPASARAPQHRHLAVSCRLESGLAMFPGFCWGLLKSIETRAAPRARPEPIPAALRVFQ